MSTQTLDNDSNTLGKRRSAITLIGVLIVLFTLTDARITLMFLLKNKLFAYLVWGGCFGAVSLVSIRMFLRYRFSPAFFVIAAVGGWGILMGALKGLSVGTLLQSVAGYLLLPALIVMSRKATVTSARIGQFFLISGVLQLIVYFGKDTVFAAVRDSYTVYGASFAMESANRFTGLWVSPGVLALFATIITAYGLARFRVLWNWRDLLLAGTGVVLGLASGNRSYLLALLITTFMVMLWRPKLPKGGKGHGALFFALLIGCVLAGFLATGVINAQSILERFLLETLQADIATRKDGGAGFIPSLRSLPQNPVIGSSVYDREYDDLMVVLDGQRYTTSNGVLSILVNHGLLAGLPFLYLYLAAIVRYRRFAASRLASDDHLLGAILFFCIVAASIVCVFDALLQMPIMLAIILFAYEKLSSSRTAVAHRTAILPGRMLRNVEV